MKNRLAFALGGINNLDLSLPRTSFMDRRGDKAPASPEPYEKSLIRESYRLAKKTKPCGRNGIQFGGAVKLPSASRTTERIAFVLHPP